MTPKSDVYSFGVVLLELVTGKPPVSRECHIVKQFRNTLARSGLTGVIHELLDSVLVGTPAQDVEAFVTIALECVEDTSVNRPGMHEVAKRLEALVGPKSYFIPGGDNSSSSKPAKRKHRVPNGLSDDFEPASGQFSQASASASSRQSFEKYSGGFDPSPR